MATSISNYDLFSLIESALEEEEVKYDRREVEDFLKDAKSDGYYKKPSSKKKKHVNQSEPKEEDFDIIDDEEEEDDKEDSSNNKEAEEEPTSINLSDALNFEIFKDNLNLSRSGHSYDSEPVKSELKNYFDSLTKEEKQALHVLIKGIIHVTLMDVKGNSAKTPSDLSISIKRSGTTSKEKKKSLDRRIDVEKKGKSVDNNTPIKVTPIKIGESRQNKASILKVINANKV